MRQRTCGVRICPRCNGSRRRCPTSRQPDRAIARAIGGETRFQVVCWQRGFPRSRAAGYANRWAARRNRKHVDVERLSASGVDKLYKTRARSAGHSSSSVFQSPAVEAAAQHRLQRTRLAAWVFEHASPPLLTDGSTLQRTRLAAWVFERKRARRGLLLKVLRRSHRAAEPGSLGGAGVTKKLALTEGSLRLKVEEAPSARSLLLKGRQKRQAQEVCS